MMAESKKEIDKKIKMLYELAQDLSTVDIPAMRFRAEMIVGLMEEMMVSVVDD